jgi:putative nucleotidyltransferase with HDIG domain
MIYDLSQHIEWFEKYSEGFSGSGNPEDQTNLAIKKEHSLRVLDNAMKISASLELDGELTQLTHLAALFHDVGRFPQYQRFRTFNDRSSANHAALSVEVLRKTDALTKLTLEHRRLVLAAIFLHNRRFIPLALPPKLGIITRIVRDADKLDILPVLIAHFSPDFPANGVVTLDLRPHPTAYTESIFCKVLSGETGKYEEMIWINDLKLLLCSWVYDLNFPVSRRIVLQAGYLDAIFGSLPPDPKFIALRQQLTQELSVGVDASRKGALGCDEGSLRRRQH